MEQVVVSSYSCVATRSGEDDRDERDWKRKREAIQYIIYTMCVYIYICIYMYIVTMYVYASFTYYTIHHSNDGVTQG